MHKNILFIVLGWIAFQSPAFAEAVDQAIAAKCASRWPDDYDMQLFCREKQKNAYDKLQKQDAVAKSKNDGEEGVVHTTTLYGKTIDDAVSAAAEIFKEGGFDALNVATQKCYDESNSSDNMAYCITLDSYAVVVSGSDKGRNNPIIAAMRAIAEGKKFFSSETVTSIVQIGLPKIVQSLKSR